MWERFRRNKPGHVTVTTSMDCLNCWGRMDLHVGNLAPQQSNHSKQLYRLSSYIWNKFITSASIIHTQLKILTGNNTYLRFGASKPAKDWFSVLARRKTEHKDFGPWSLLGQALTEGVGYEDDGGLGLGRSRDVGLLPTEVDDDLAPSASRVQRRRVFKTV
jgi:hypothetical protein